MYNPNRKIFGFGGDDIPTAEKPKQNFMRKPVKFQTAETEVQTDEHTTTKWSIVHGFDAHGYYRCVVPPDTNLVNFERPFGTPNYTDYIPAKKTS
jgi:hypothetical protein